MTLDDFFFSLGVCVVASPALLFAMVGLSALLGRPLGERALANLTETSVLVGLSAALTILVLMLVFNVRHVPIELGNWVVIPQQHFHFHLKFVFDRLSVPFLILSYILCGTMGAFVGLAGGVHPPSGISTRYHASAALMEHIYASE